MKHPLPHPFFRRRPFRLASAAVLCLLLLTACGEKAPAAGNADDPARSGQDPSLPAAVTTADLDRDGRPEELTAAPVSEELWELRVTAEDGTLLWSQEAGLPHTGWNSLFLYSDGDASYLLRYTPAVSGGAAAYAYSLFSLENGEETVQAENALEWELKDTAAQLPAILAFGDEINALLAKSQLLLSTWDGEAAVGPAAAEPECFSALDGFLNASEIAHFTQAFRPVIEENGTSRTNSINGFFTSHYERPQDLDLAEFLRYFPMGSMLDPDTENPEFQALSAHERFPFKELEDLPVPIHRYAAADVDDVLMLHAGITAAELTGRGAENVLYLPEFQAYYNFTSDFGPGMFSPAYGIQEGDCIRLYEAGAEGGVLTLQDAKDGYLIVSHLPRSQ